MHIVVQLLVFVMLIRLLQLGVTGKFGLGIRNEAGQRLIEFCQENALVITNTLFQQHKRRLYTWTSPDGQHRNRIDYILCSQRWRSFIQSAKTRPGADCGSEHELIVAKFKCKLKKVGKTTRSFRYDLNQIPYNYTVEVRNRFKGLELIECLKNYGRRFVTLYRRQWSKPSPGERNAWRIKWQPTPVFLPGESHGQRSLVGYSPRGRKRSDTTERLQF